MVAFDAREGVRTLAQAVAELHTAPHGGGHGIGHDAGHADHPPTSTGIDNRKLGMWLFLASDCVFFGSLIAVYMIYRGRAEQLFLNGQGTGPLPFELIDIPYTSVSAFVLLMSSMTMVLALAGIQKGNLRSFRVWLAATALLGSIFLGGQWFEFTSFYHEGLGYTTNMFSMTFFTVTGFHGLHVTLGVIWLLTILIVSLRGGVRKDQALNVEIAGLYWHFVDIVWIIIFTLIYLIPYDEVHSIVEEGEHALRFLGLN